MWMVDAVHGGVTRIDDTILLPARIGGVSLSQGELLPLETGWAFCSDKLMRSGEINLEGLYLLVSWSVYKTR